ncbi:hypothetical protein Tco_0388943 [Tanacetum coccineum]
MIIGPSVPSSSPKGGNEISRQGEKLCVIFCLAFDELRVGDSVHESGDSHAFWGFFNMPTFSFKPLHEILCGFPFSLLDVVDIYRILDALLLLKRNLPLRCLTFVFSTLTSNVPLHCLHFLRAAPLFVNRNPGSGFLSDADLSRRILEKTLVGSGLLDVMRERLGFSLLLRYPLLFGVLDSEYCYLLLATVDDNAYHSIAEGLRQMQAYLDFLRFALSLFPLCFARRTWVG